MHQLCRFGPGVPQYSLFPACEKGESASELRSELTRLPHAALNRGSALAHARPAPRCISACCDNPSPKPNNNPIKTLVGIISVTRKALTAPLKCCARPAGSAGVAQSSAWARSLLEKGLPRPQPHGTGSSRPVGLPRAVQGSGEAAGKGRTCCSPVQREFQYPLLT